MKICSRCKQEKSSSKFNKKGNGLGTYCKECNKQYLKEHYRKNTEYYIEKAKRYFHKISRKILDYLEQHPCIDCGEVDIVVLDFDHRDPKKKVASVRTIARQTCSWEKVKNEIAKCDVRCANCHRRHTAKSNDWYSWY